MTITGQKITIERAKDTGQAMVLLLLLLIFFKEWYLLVLPAIIVQVLNMTWPALFKPMAVCWFGLTGFIGRVISRFLLTMVFGLMVIPVGVFRKMLGKDPMGVKNWKVDTRSVFVIREHVYGRDDLENPY